MFLIILFVYFFLLLGISYLTGRHHSTDNSSFFLGKRQSPWWIVAIGMVGSSLSGVSFVSVPGMVGVSQFTYMQTVFGFIVGYFLIAQVLLPLYYRLNLTSIYSYLGSRLGRRSHKTGASFFLLSKLMGAAVRLYVVAFILQNFVLYQWNIPFWVTVCSIIFMIWLYTFRSGIKTIIWTDTLQTLCLLAALVLLVINTVQQLNVPLHEATQSLIADGKMRLFLFDDWHSKQNFFKQFFSGIFIALVMTGLDQDMMQKNLTCKSLKEAQKNMYTYGLLYLPVNFLFLFLGALMLYLAQQNQVALPVKGDEILPMFAMNYLGTATSIFFIIGIVAAAFSSADSALTALTTSFMVDIVGVDANDKHAKQKRMVVHLSIAVIFAIIILLFQALNNTSVIDAVYIIASYTYGPLLGMFAFGLFMHQIPTDKWVPYIAIAAPVLCYLLQLTAQRYWNYSFGYELLMLNGLIVFLGLWAVSKKAVKS